MNIYEMLGIIGTGFVLKRIVRRDGPFLTSSPFVRVPMRVGRFSLGNPLERVPRTPRWGTAVPLAIQRA